jgi:hypothetical protein
MNETSASAKSRSNPKTSIRAISTYSDHGSDSVHGKDESLVFTRSIDPKMVDVLVHGRDTREEGTVVSVGT